MFPSALPAAFFLFDSEDCSPRSVAHGGVEADGGRKRGDAWSLLPFPGRTAVREGVGLKPGPPASASGCLSWVGV